MSAAARGGRTAVPADVGSLALARLLAGPGGTEEIARALGWPPARVQDGTLHLQQATGARTRTDLVADYAWAGHLTARHLGAQDLSSVHGLGVEERLLLRLTAAGVSDRAAGREIGSGTEVVHRRREALFQTLGVTSGYQAVGLGCLAGVVRRADMPARFEAVRAPVPGHLHAPTALAHRQLAAEGRALVVVPRREQAALAGAVGARAGGLHRVLVITAPGAYWEHDLAVLAAAHRDAGQFLAVVDRAEAARLPLPPGVAAASSARAVRAAVGTTLPAVLVATPDGLESLTRLHRDGLLAPLDLTVVLDAHQPALRDLLERHDGIPPGAGVLRLTATARFITCDRSGRDGCDPAVTGPLTAALALRAAADLGLMRGYRLAAAATARSARHMGPAALVADLTRAHGLRRIVVHSSRRDSRRLAEALGRTGLAAEVLPVHARAQALDRFTDATVPRVLVVDGPMPPGLGADALVHALTGAATEHTAAVVEAALTPAGPGGGPLLLVSADRTEEGWTALADLTGALAALDPHLARDLARAREQHTGHNGLEFLLPLPPGADEQRARAVCAWADTTWAEEMRVTAARAAADGRARCHAYSPSGRPLTAWTPPAPGRPARPWPDARRTA
ncbi:hypothetical protein ACW14Y_41505 [Kitasatospora sp. cg17-2]